MGAVAKPQDVAPAIVRTPPILAATPIRDLRLPQRRADDANVDDALRRELYFFNLYRMFEAALLALMLFSPAGALNGEPRYALIGKLTTVSYLGPRLVLLTWAPPRATPVRAGPAAGHRQLPGCVARTAVLGALAARAALAGDAGHRDRHR